MRVSDRRQQTRSRPAGKERQTGRGGPDIQERASAAPPAAQVPPPHRGEPGQRPLPGHAGGLPRGATPPGAGAALRPCRPPPGPLAPLGPRASGRPHRRPRFHLANARGAAPATGTAGRGGPANVPRHGAGREKGVPSHIPGRAAVAPGVRPAGLRPAVGVPEDLASGTPWRSSISALLRSSRRGWCGTAGPSCWSPTSGGWRRASCKTAG